MADDELANTAQQPKHMYQRLPTPTSIRLLVVTPKQSAAIGTDDHRDVVSARMIIADLDDPTLSFIALSYVWGESKSYAMGLGNTRLVEVTHNLRLALSDVSRRIRNPTLIWVDALCINQADTAERSAQVAMMYRIYSAARLVIVHLGHADEDSDYLPWIVKALAGAYDYYGRPLRSIAQPVRSIRMDTADISASGLAALNSNEWRALRRFLQRPWFHRSWTLQETQAARDALFLCEGWTEVLDYGMLSLAVAAVRVLQLPVDIDTSVETRLFSEGGTPLLLDVLTATCDDRCSDPRDAIYACLSISNEANKPELSPDYDLDVAAVYHKFALHFVQRGQGLQLLYQCSLNEAQPSMPSWVPRWNMQDSSRTRTTLRQRNPTLRDSLSIRAAADKKTLVIRGAIVDRVEAVGSVHPPIEFDWTAPATHCKAVLSYLNESQQLVAQLANTIKLQYDDIALTSWAALIARSPNAEHITEAMKDADFRLFYRDVFPHIEPQDGTPTISSQRAAPFGSRFEKLFEWSCLFTRLALVTAASKVTCITAKGYLGKIDRMSSPGDLVALIHGVQHPFLLRPIQRGNGGQAYKFVGHAFIIGMEDGEAWSWSDTEIVDLHLV